MLISVIIPCYNVEKYVDDCIRSVLAQSYSDIEIIAVDDRSSDSTYEKLQQLQQEAGGKLVIKRNVMNSGAPYTRNEGLKLAKGKYIQFLDADDILLPGKIAHQVKIVSANEPVLIAANYKREQINGEYVEKKNGFGHNPWYGLINSMLGCTCSNLWPRDEVIKAGGWNEGLKSSQEYDLMFRMLKNGVRVEYDEAFLTIVRDRESGSISLRDRGGNWKRYIDLRIKILEFLSQSGQLNEELRNVALQRIFEAVRVLYSFDRKTAIEVHDQYINKKYSPHSSEWISRTYLWVYNLLGFRVAEQVKSILK